MDEILLISSPLGSSLSISFLQRRLKPRARRRLRRFINPSPFLNSSSFLFHSSMVLHLILIIFLPVHLIKRPQAFPVSHIEATSNLRIFKSLAGSGFLPPVSHVAAAGKGPALSPCVGTQRSNVKITGIMQVTWVEHAEYDEAAVHHLYRPLLRSGMALGARRWVATLQRQCECLAILMSSSLPNRDHTAITAAGRRSMLKLTQRMTDNFCDGVCASSARKWSRLVNVGSIGEDVRVMTRQSMNDPGEPPGVVLSAATSVWLPVSPPRLFDFLRDESLRSQWDILSNGGPMQEMAHIAKGQDQGNAVSLLRASAVNLNQSSMLILQETCTDSSGSMVVYAPVDVPAMHLVMNGGDSAYVALLPSGFAVIPDGPAAEGKIGGASLLTVSFQILVNSLPTAKLTVESVETVNNLISCTVQKIKAALRCDM